MFSVNYKKIVLSLVLAGTLAVISLAHAQLNLLDKSKLSSTNDNTGLFQKAAGFANSNSPQTDLADKVANIIKIFIGLLGVIFIILFISAGYNWFMAGGDAAKVTLAKDKMTRAVIGLTVIVAAYAITYFVFSQLNTIGVVNGSPSSPSAGAQNNGR